MSGHYLQLCTNPLRFKPIGVRTNVFFDEANRQVFVVLDGEPEITVTTWEGHRKTVIGLPKHGHIMSIKYSPDKKFLAVQRSPQVVEFFNSTGGLQCMHQCKGKATEVRSFHWTNTNDIAFITNHGVELYQIFSERKNLKSVKSVALQTNWFVFSCEKNVLVLSSGQPMTTMHPFFFRPGQLIRLSKFDIDMPSSVKLASKGSSPVEMPRLTERDTALAVLYGVLYLVVVRNQMRGMAGGAEVSLYHITREAPARRTAILQLDMSGRFAVNTVDNLLIVHHQASMTSTLFDIRWGGSMEGSMSFHHPVLAGLPIAPATLSVLGQDGVENLVSCELYSPNWVVFQPNIIIDAKLGCMWLVDLKMEPLVGMMSDKKRLVEFLLLREKSKTVILDVCRQALVPGQQTCLSVIARVFDILNSTCSQYLQQHTAVQAKTADESLRGVGALAVEPSFNLCVIDQHDMYKHVFSQIVDIKAVGYKFFVAVVIEYIRSLNSFQLTTQHFLYEMVIKLLVENNRFYQLHQFLQYHALSDSKPLACLMLSLESVYPPAYQLALDMLKRLSSSNEDIIDVLLSKNQLVPALRFLRSMGREESASARVFLEAAANSGDNTLFYHVFKFFEDRNIRMRRKPDFLPADRCEQYVMLFNSQFGSRSHTR